MTAFSLSFCASADSAPDQNAPAPCLLARLFPSRADDRAPASPPKRHSRMLGSLLVKQASTRASTAHPKAPSNDVVNACVFFLNALGADHTLLAAKAYRVELPESLELPVIPCLDHEAHLDAHVEPHVSVYVEDGEGDLHEVGFVPSTGALTVDEAATLGHSTDTTRERFKARLGELFPDSRLRVKKPGVLRGDERVAAIVRAQVRLGDVLRGPDARALEWRLDQLKAIGDLMEKESRVSSWTVRTLTAPVLAAAGAMSWWVVGLLSVWLSELAVEALRYVFLTGLGGAFLWIGLKAVHLTEMGTRVWKRATEYRLILKARERVKSRESPARAASG